jgi:hypothetical protein
MKLEMEFDAGLRGTRREIAVSPIVNPDDRTADTFKIGLWRSWKVLKTVPIHGSHGYRPALLLFIGFLHGRVVMA